MVKDTFKKISSKKITSLQNPLVKHLVKLKENRSYRDAEQKALAIGNKSIEQIAKYISPTKVFSLDPLLSDLSRNLETENYFVSEEILKKISGMPSFRESIAEFPIPKPVSFKDEKFLIALDGISDPGNLGTLLRTALALKWQGVFVLPGCCDLFNDKTIRASKGGSFLLPYQTGSHEMLFALSCQLEAPIIIADLHGKDLSKLSALPKAILVLSNEARGVNDQLYAHHNLLQKVTIPMAPHMESLNVAAAGAILMYQLKGIAG